MQTLKEVTTNIVEQLMGMFFFAKKRRLCFHYKQWLEFHTIITEVNVFGHAIGVMCDIAACICDKDIAKVNDEIPRHIGFGMFQNVLIRHPQLERYNNVMYCLKHFSATHIRESLNSNISPRYFLWIEKRIIYLHNVICNSYDSFKQNLNRLYSSSTVLIEVDTILPDTHPPQSFD